MFVLPPPPRYPPLAQPGMNPTFNPPGVGGAPLVESHNTLGHPTGPEFMFSVGEGVYTLQDDIMLATPPPHPSEAPVLNPNPLATVPVPATSGTRLSTVVIKHPEFSRLSVVSTLASSNATHSDEKGSEPRTSLSTDGSDYAAGSGSGGSRNGGETPTATQPPPLPSQTAGGATGVGAPPIVQNSTAQLLSDKIGGGMGSHSHAGGKEKRKKPKNNIVKSNSSFVSRIITHEHLGKKLNDRNPESLLVFANISRAFNFLDMGSTSKQEALSKILFTRAHPLSHDVNQVTKSPGHVDVIIGFSSGDIIWFDPIVNKYARLNKNGAINSSPVYDIHWLPGSENLFLAAHGDGSLVLYDKEKDDAPFVAENSPPGTASTTGADGETNGTNSERAFDGGFFIAKSVESKNQKFNPMAFWTVSKQALNAFAFSPDNQHLAVVGEDGGLRIVNVVKEQLLDLYTSYYGGLLCVCWSPDGRYVLTGGQDDLVSIWSFTERRIVARCHGHHSWVTSVAFDPWRCDERTYRFGSVGEDCRLLLWDFNVGMLIRPKAQTAVSSRGVIRATEVTTSRLRSESVVSGGASTEEDEGIKHAMEPRSRTANLPAIMSKLIDPDPLTTLLFREDCIITTCKEGHIRTWLRPQPKDAIGGGPGSSQITLSAAS